MEKGIFLNGQSSMAVAKDNDIIYRLNSIDEITPMYLGLIPANNAKVFDLSKSIERPYKIVSFSIDIATDDTADWQSDPTTFYPIFENIDVEIIEDDTIISYRRLDTRGASVYTLPFYIFPHQFLRISIADVDARASLFCVPIVANKTINLIPNS